MKGAFGVLLVVALGSCHARENEFYEKVFACDPNGPADACGTTKSGAAMVCFPGKQLGSMDFCAERCESDGPIDDNFVCEQSARLQKCDPSSPSSSCPSAMGCAGVGNGDGLCMPPCQGAECASVTIGPDGSAGTLAGIACDSHTRCRPTSSGKKAICYAVQSLGGMDFCAEECDPAQTPSDPTRFTCAEPGALLQRCQPDGPLDQADCPEEFACYRTRLSENEGVCLWKMHLCASDAQCALNTEDGRTTCASSLVENIFAGTLLPISLAPGIHLDHLSCVHRYCDRNSSNCQPTEGCLGKEYASPYADFCVPQCGGVSPCPPNYSCSLGTSGPGSPSLCLPGILGVRCKGNQCISGTCEDTGAGFSVCATSCNSNDDCKLLSSASDTFVCVSGGGFQHCVASRPFHGANCYNQNECMGLEKCYFFDGFGDSVAAGGHGECRLPCKQDGTCDPRGGLPHTCVVRRGVPDDQMASCFPGELGLGCQLATECISGLSCLAVSPEPEPDLPPTHDKLCTIPCGVDGGTDADADPQCDVSSAINHNGYCANGFCRGRRLPEQPCNRDAQCNTRHCNGTRCQ